MGSFVEHIKEKAGTNQCLCNYEHNDNETQPVRVERGDGRNQSGWQNALEEGVARQQIKADAFDHRDWNHVPQEPEASASRLIRRKCRIEHEKDIEDAYPDHVRNQRLIGIPHLLEA